MYNVFAFPHEFMKRIQTFKLGLKKILLSLENKTLFRDTKNKNENE